MGIVRQILLALTLVGTKGVHTCDITDFGAIGNNATDSTVAIQTALSNATCTMVVVPPGWFLSKSLSLANSSGKTLFIQPDAALVLWRNISEYGKGDFLQSASLLQNFTLTGGGRIVGGGSTWWPYGKSIFRPRIFGASDVAGLTVSNLSFIDSPFWNM
jgi:rhamnogalacturonan hydrolase